MKSILIVDDNKPNLATAKAVLTHDYRVIPVLRGEQALTYLESGACDILLLDINMPEMDGFEVLRRIRAMARCQDLPVIFLTGDHDAETETRCFKAGAVDVITKPFVPEVMLSRIARALEHEEMRRSLADRLEQKTLEVKQIKTIAQQDALTCLSDRGYTEETIDALLREGVTGALMMMDLDDFKSINDSYGHAEGDRVLKLCAETLRSCAAEGDVLGRVGGDEFVLFMKDAPVKAEVRDRAVRIIEALRQRIDARHLEVDTSISIGIARTPEDGQTFAQLYNCADKALYHVKRNGKNAYHFFSDRLQAESIRARHAEDVRHLLEVLRRADNGQGAYLLDLDGFQNVYHFIQRNVDRWNLNVTALLFTLGGEEDERAMDVLEKVVGTYLRRTDVATRYSRRQLIAMLMEAESGAIGHVAERMVESFHQLYGDGPASLDYDVAHIESRLTKRSAGAPQEA